jgi:hypothetical protein
VVVQGWLLSGMSTTVVLPPAAAAAVPVSMPASHQIGRQHTLQLLLWHVARRSMLAR